MTRLVLLASACMLALVLVPCTPAFAASTHGRADRLSVANGIPAAAGGITPARSSPAHVAHLFATAAEQQALANDAAQKLICDPARFALSVPNTLNAQADFGDAPTQSPMQTPCDPRALFLLPAGNSEYGNVRSLALSVYFPAGDVTARSIWAELSVLPPSPPIYKTAGDSMQFNDLPSLKPLSVRFGGAYGPSYDCYRPEMGFDRTSAYCGHCELAPFTVTCADSTLGFASDPTLAVVNSAPADCGGLTFTWSLLPPSDPSLTDNQPCVTTGEPDKPACHSLYERWFDEFDVQLFDSDTSGAEGDLRLTLPKVKARADGTVQLAVAADGIMTLISAAGSTAGVGDAAASAALRKVGAHHFTVRFHNQVTDRFSARSNEVQVTVPDCSATLPPPPPPPTSSTGTHPPPSASTGASSGGSVVDPPASSTGSAGSVAGSTGSGGSTVSSSTGSAPPPPPPPPPPPQSGGLDTTGDGTSLPEPTPDFTSSSTASSTAEPTVDPPPTSSTPDGSDTLTAGTASSATALTASFGSCVLVSIIALAAALL